MDSLLNQLSAVPGVVGSMVCDAQGQVLVHAFPPLFDPSMLQTAASILADGTAGLETATGPISIIDLRFADARIVVKPVANAHLLFLCAPSLNLQLLSMSASVAAPKIERLLAERGGRAEAAPSGTSGAGRLYRAIQKIEAAIEQRKLDRFKVRGQIALQAGFGFGFIDPDTPDDPERLSKLEAAASAVLGEPI